MKVLLLACLVFEMGKYCNIPSIYTIRDNNSYHDIMIILFVSIFKHFHAAQMVYSATFV